MTNAPTLVVGHRNPDMDAIAAAVGYAYVLDTLGPDHYVAGRLGDLNPQTAFAVLADECLARATAKGAFMPRQKLKLVLWS